MSYFVSPSGASYYIGPAYATTLPVQNLVATADATNQITLTWGNISPDSNALIEVDRSSDGTNYTVLTNTLAAGSTSYTDSDPALVEATHYWYRVRALESGGPSGYTDPADTYTLPLAPSTLSASVIGPNEVDLSWTNNSAGSPDVGILRSEDGTNFDTIDVLAPGTTTYADTSAVDGTPYTYQVVAMDPGGQSTASSSVSGPTPLDVPFDLSATVFDSSEIDLSWGNVSKTATGYSVLRGTDGVHFSWLANVVGIDACYYSDTTCSPGTHYYYQVQATNSSTTSPVSNTADGITDPTLNVAATSPTAEGTPYSLGLAVNHDPSVTDPVTGWDITWGDGSTQHVTGDPGTITHVYTEPGSFSITATSDGFTGFAASQTASIYDVTPNLSLSGSNSVNENTTYTLNASFTDPGGDHVKEWLINWGDGNTTDLPVSSPPPDTLGTSTDTQSFTHQYLHGHATYIINAQALTDDDLTPATASVQVINANINPYQDPNGPYEGGTYALNITPARDGGTNDPVTYTIDWGDGTSPTTCQGSADGTSVPVQDHQYNEEGLRLVTVTPSYGSIQYTYVGTADASPTIAIPPEQAVAAGQSLSVSSSFTGGAADDQWVSFIDLGDGTGKHAGSVGSGGSLSFNVAAPTAPGVYHPVITLYDKGGTAEATATYIMDVWGVVIDKGENNDVLTATTDGTHNLQPVTFYFPHPDGVALDLTLGITDATDDYMWSIDSPEPGSTPLLGGSATSMSLSVSASQTSLEYWVGAINGNATPNVLQFTLAGAVIGNPSLPPGTVPVPATQPIKSNAASNLKVQIISLSNPNGDQPSNGDITDGSTDWLVGQMVDLKAVVIGPTVNAARRSSSWSVPGRVLRDYIGGSQTGTRVPLEDLNTQSRYTGLTQREVEFLWYATAYNPLEENGPDTDTISVKVTGLPGVGTGTAESTFHVYSPSSGAWADHGALRGNDPFSPTTIGLFGTGPDAPFGIQWHAWVATPSIFKQGEYRFLQRVNPWRSWEMASSYNFFKTPRVNDPFGLDTENPYNTTPDDPFAPGIEGWYTDTGTHQTNDNPRQGLINYKSPGVPSPDQPWVVGMADNFQTNVMYLAPGDSRWVSLQSISWGYNMIAMKGDVAFATNMEFVFMDDWRIVKADYKPALPWNFVLDTTEPRWTWVWNSSNAMDLKPE